MNQPTRPQAEGMQVYWIFYGCNEEDEARVQQFWDEREIQTELEGKLAELTDAPSQLRIAVEQSDNEPEWNVEAALHVPGKTLVATSSARSPEEALDSLRGGLAEEVDRQQELTVHVAKRWHGLEGIVPLLQQWHGRGHSEAFLSFLAPTVASLGPYVQRELQVRESEGSLIGEEITTTDVLDEVLVRAWDQFGQRKGELPLDLWLMQLADQAMDRLSQPVSEESIQEQEPVPWKDLQESDRDQWIEQASYPETIEMSELFPGAEGVADWDSLDLDTKQAHLVEILGRLPRERRQAFVLDVVHGYEIPMIADFQNRPVEQVREDVAEAITQVRNFFIEQEYLDLEEPFEQRDLRERRGVHHRKSE